MSMPTVTIPKEFAKRNDLMAVPRKEYEAFLRTKIREVKPTKSELRAIRAGEKAIARGDFVTLEELKNELDSRYRRSGKKSH